MVDQPDAKEGKAPADRPLRLLVLASKPPGISPSQRFRLEQWAPHLAADHRITLDFVPYESPALAATLYKPGHVARKGALVLRDFLRRAAVVRRARHYDAVVVHREAALIGPAFYESLIARTGVPIIFDFDDSIWSPSQAMDNGIFSRLHFFGKTATLCRIAAACTPGNAFLGDYARQFNDRVHVVPTSIELADYPAIPEPASDNPFIVCWTGSSSTLRHFEFARESLEKLAERLPLAVKVICNQPPARPIAGAEMRFVPWSRDAEAREIGDSHAGIMPLPDDEVSRGKCGLKALQCMATGRPVVVAPVGVNREIIDHGRNGFLATTSDDYVDALMRLAQSPALRAEIGAKGRETVAQSYSAPVAAAKFAAVVRSVV